MLAHTLALSLRAMGARRMTCALLMLLHDRWAVLAVLLTAFGRAIAEVGAVMIVGSNIAGVTRVMTTAISLETRRTARLRRLAEDHRCDPGAARHREDPPRF
jgi:ABC-type tungstate transport system substrate-binding protein